MKLSKFFSNYLKASDVKAPVQVTIASYEVVEGLDREDPEKAKVVLYFTELEQGLVLNSTNHKQLVDLFGTDEGDEFVGKRVELYQDKTVSYQGHRGGVRVREIGGGV